jgi:hypothetical protein
MSFIHLTVARQLSNDRQPQRDQKTMSAALVITPHSGEL